MSEYVGKREPIFPPLPSFTECWCHVCHGKKPLTHMIVCPTCGNKRCPHASDHLLVCTGSNESGQPGSVYGKAESAPPETKT